MHAAIVGLSGPVLTAAETALFRHRPPAGVILFARNIEAPRQLQALTASVRAIVPGALIAVDQEGGRVQRLRPPHWPGHPAAGRIGGLPPDDARRAAWITGALIGLECRDAGFDLVCAPVLDLAHPGGHDVVGDRSFGADPAVVAALGRAMADGLLAAGVQPVAKHAPGHGGATVDSHHALPCVTGDRSADVAPFAALSDLPWMMTAHLLYPTDPAQPGTLSPPVLRLIREQIGFRGVLVSDDLAMGALTGSAGERAAEAIAAGCDIALHCTGVIEETGAVLDAAGMAPPATQARLQAGRDLALFRRQPLDAASLRAERDALL